MDNPVRSCLACGQEDDHPRHVVVIPPDMAEVPWHFDCHAAITNCESCTVVVKTAKGKTGEDLRTHIMTKKG